MADVPADIPAVSQKAQNIIVRINKVEATIRNVEKVVQDAKNLLNGDRSWDTIGHKWVKSLVDGLEELKKDLRQQVKELREEYREDVGALKVAVVGIKTNVQETKTDVQEMAQKMGETQKVIDGLMAASDAGMAQQQESSAAATVNGQEELQPSRKRKNDNTAIVNEAGDGIEHLEEVEAEAPSKKVKLSLKVKGDFIINVSQWNAKKGEFEDCIERKANASQLTSAASINRFVKDSMRKNEPSFSVTNPKIVLRLQKLSNLDADDYAVASHSVKTWLAWVKVLKGNASPRMKAYVYTESAAKAADAIAKAD